MVEVPFLFAPKSDIFPCKETQTSKSPSHSPAALGVPGAPWGQGRGREGVSSWLVVKALVLDSYTTQLVSDQKVGGGGRRPSTRYPNTWLGRALNRSVRTPSVKLIVGSRACLVNRWQFLLGRAGQSGGDQWVKDGSQSLV